MGPKNLNNLVDVYKIDALKNETNKSLIQRLTCKNIFPGKIDVKPIP